MQTHENLERGRRVSGPGDRAFGLTFAGVFGVLAFWPLARGAGIGGAALGAAGVFLALAVLRPSLLAPLNRLWLRFGLLLHRVTSPLILAVVFFAVLTPIAAVMRALGKRTLRLEPDRSARSYWIPRTPPGPAPETMTRQF